MDWKQMTPGTVWALMFMLDLKKRRSLRISVLVISKKHHPIIALIDGGDRSLQHDIRRWKQE